jgi:hypothetical protein
MNQNGCSLPRYPALSMPRITCKTPLLLSEFVSTGPLPKTGHGTDNTENTSSNAFSIVAQCRVLRNRSANIAVTLWARIREMLDLNPARDTGYPASDSSLFSAAPPDKCWDNIWIRPRLLPSKYFPVHHSYTILPYSLASVGVLKNPHP